MKKTIISFSGRKNGNCSNIGRMLYQSEEDSIFYDFSEISITPCTACSLECFKEGQQCPYRDDMVYTIYDSIMHSDMTFFIVPNYCDYPCSLYFIFNERSQCYFQHHPQLLEQYLEKRKKFIVISNTNQENFIKAFEYQSQKPDILFLSAKRYNKISIRGDLLDSLQAIEDIKNFAEE